MSLADVCETCGAAPFVVCECADDHGVTDIDAVCEAVIQAKNAEIERLLTELVQLRAHVAHNDEEYKVMKDVLRAEHQACCAMRPIVEAAKVWRSSHLSTSCIPAGCGCEKCALVAAIDAARGKL